MAKTPVGCGHPADAFDPISPFFRDKVPLGYRIHVLIGFAIENQPASSAIVKACWRILGYRCRAKFD
ncbi:MAG: hypothetical protein ACO1NN_00845 [Sphingopyxis sp.]